MNYAFDLHVLDGASIDANLAQKLACVEDVPRDEFGQTQADISRSVEQYGKTHAPHVSPSKRAQYLAAIRPD